MFVKTKENWLMLTLVAVMALVANWYQAYDLIDQMPVIFDIPYFSDAIPKVFAMHFPEI
ncbi:hypothetical protein [Planomicrobium sp. CPCC 101079]|uniref:hypothetical protein n=1 Tax=Planomicrobium sp. CPCC 101079 TaxID=2599618 RepID=UPI001644B4FF|nr:hypothetical protein [Planomicrobium sp. CPCC 101079]